jgi:DNA-directed RNA polymerase subunit RPC12/RpoP
MKEKTPLYYDRLLEKEYPDIYKTRQGKIKKMIRNIIIYELFFLLVAYGAYDYITRNIALFSDRSIVYRGLILGVIFAVIPPLLFESTGALLEKTWVGTIDSIKYEMRYPQTSGALSKSINRSHPKEFMKIKVDIGKKRKKTVAFHSHFNQALQKGDRIVKFRGFQFPVEDTESEKYYICIVCGKIVKKGVKQCPACEHSIVDLHKAALPKDVWAELNYAKFD